jgi:DNA-binding CsgD family transcriptional regulator
MSDKEKTVLILLVHDLTNREIADAMGVSKHYVYYLSRLLKARFSVNTTVALVARAIAEGIISGDGQILPPSSNN